MCGDGELTPTEFIGGIVIYKTHSINVRCPICKQVVATKIIGKSNRICDCIFGCWTKCSIHCQDVEHRCPKCDYMLGYYDPVCVIL